MSEFVIGNLVEIISTNPMFDVSNPDHLDSYPILGWSLHPGDKGSPGSHKQTISYISHKTLGIFIESRIGSIDKYMYCRLLVGSNLLWIARHSVRIIK